MGDGRARNADFHPRVLDLGVIKSWRPLSTVVLSLQRGEMVTDKPVIELFLYIILVNLIFDIGITMLFEAVPYLLSKQSTSTCTETTGVYGRGGKGYKS